MNEIDVVAADAADIDDELPAEIDAPKRKAADLIAGENAIGGDLLEHIVEGALLAAGKPLLLVEIGALFEDQERPSSDSLRAALAAIGERYAGRGFELREVASGYRFQVVQNVAPWIARLWEEKPQRYSRALLETLSLIAYRQPITRGDIEDIRGVAVASNIVKTLLEREWVRVVGHKDVPGRPAMYATTRKFLDYFNLKNLEDLPALAEIRDLDSLNAELSLEGADTPLLDTFSHVESDGAEVADDVIEGDIVDSDAELNSIAVETSDSAEEAFADDEIISHTDADAIADADFDEHPDAEDGDESPVV